MKKRSFEEVKKTEPQKERIFKLIKNLDVQIRTIKEEINEDRKEVYYIVEVGFCESMGERGFNYSFFYDDLPTEEEIIKDIKEYIKEEVKELENKLLGYYEEEQLKILKRVLE